MAGGRRPGPAPSEQRRRRNADVVLPAGEGWTEISGDAWEGDVPAIPGWVEVGDAARAVYGELARLPQAATWGPGTWFELHLALPLVDRYLARPGSEGFKALVSAFGAGLALTELDMQRARIKVKPEPVDSAGVGGAGEGGGNVSRMDDRRRRLTEHVS